MQLNKWAVQNGSCSKGETGSFRAGCPDNVALAHLQKSLFVSLQEEHCTAVYLSHRHDLSSG